MSLGKKKMLSQGAAGGVVATDNFNTVLYTGNGGTQAVTGVGFQPDFVWIKRRDGSANHVLFDSVRGVGERLHSDTTDSEASTLPNGLTSFDSNGFTVVDNSGGGTGVNGSSQTYASWNWYAPTSQSVSASGSILASTIKKNVDSGFSIVRYDVGTQSSSQQISHGLGVAPKLIIDKIINDSNFGWNVYSEPTGTGKALSLNNDGTVFNDAGFCSVVNNTIMQSKYTSQSNTQHIVYCFADVAGYQKIGSYTGTNSTNGPIVYTTDDGTATGTGGFEPAFLLIKGTQSTTQWLIIDNKRSTSNPRNKALFANLNDAEGTNNSIDFFTNGFQPITTDGDSNRAETYIYLAIA